VATTPLADSRPQHHAGRR